MRNVPERLLTTMLALIIILAPAFVFAGITRAAPLTNRSVFLGSSRPSVLTQQSVNFTIPTAGTLGSIELEYCTNDPFIGTPCTAPNGLDMSFASIIAQSGETGFAVHGLTNANRLLITRTAAANPAAQPVAYTFNNVFNPSDLNTTVFVRISTFATEDGTGSRTDSGAAAFRIVPGLGVSAFVPPFLTFCVGITVSGDCSASAGNFLQLGELSKANANFGTSQFAGATNDPGGYSTFLAGNTLASGTNTIPALSSPVGSKPGSSQFGLNLVSNSNPSIGSNRTGIGSSTIQNGFGSTNQFKLSNEIVTSSPISTDFNVFTISYLVNVSDSQKPGIYTSTFTYIATAAF